MITILSTPAPPLILSAPAPPRIKSTPAPPTIVSLPAPAATVPALPLAPRVSVSAKLVGVPVTSPILTRPSDVVDVGVGVVVVPVEVTVAVLQAANKVAIEA